MTWFNGFFGYRSSNLELDVHNPNTGGGRELNDPTVGHDFTDVAFVEESDTWMWALARGILNPSRGVINGCQLQPHGVISPRPLSSQWETMAYGAKVYQ